MTGRGKKTNYRRSIGSKCFFTCETCGSGVVDGDRIKCPYLGNMLRDPGVYCAVPSRYKPKGRKNNE